jgi:NADPH-dependent 2,4-dienoyl-CoA reductase/sulfur reductase-like enzyme
LDPEEHHLTTEQGETFGYEKLLLATGGHAWRLPIPGNDLPRVFTLRTIEDSEHIREAGADAAHALVLGGSFIGSEVAASLTMSGLDVTMVFPESRLLERVAPERLSAFLHRKYADRGVRILSGTKPERLEGDGAVERAHLDDGETLDVDMVVMGVGIRLNTALARDAGLKLNEQGAVLVDDYLRTSAPDVYAAGDIAAWPDPTFEERLRVEHWDVARRQGRRAGQNMAGDEAPYTALPYFFSDMFDVSFEVWGNLNTWERTVTRGSLESGSFAFYYFDAGKLVGVMAVGRPDGERKPMQKLVRARGPYDELRDALTDENVDLNTLV